MSIKIAPSILTADFSNLGALVKELEKGGADLLHLDIMDGKFVPNLTFGPVVVASLHKVTSIPLDVHLMVEEPERLFSAFAKAGADSLTIHAETCPHLHRSIQMIKDLGCNAGVALNPATPLDVLDYIYQELDHVLLMTVNPGWGGQKFISAVYRKIRDLREMLINTGASADLQVDGGINFSTIKEAVDCGANSLVIGSALLKEQDLPKAIKDYRSAAEEASAGSWWQTNHGDGSGDDGSSL
jgi:ribulose-phosphate 3-epimerase